MAAAVKFQKFVRDLGLGVHNLDTAAHSYRQTRWRWQYAIGKPQQFN